VHTVHIHKTQQQCNLIIHKKQIKHLIQKNASPPTLKALLKIHKPDIPIRPIINNRNAPSYKIAKKLNDIPKKHLHLDDQYITSNSTNLANDLIKLKINNRHKLITLDIKDLYVNIPVKETVDITRTHW
jgi:hypothetical protein